MNKLDADKQEIKELKDFYLDKRYPDFFAVSQCLLDIARDNPELADLSLATMFDLASIEHGTGMAVAG